jgi:hypothetical protein
MTATKAPSTMPAEFLSDNLNPFDPFNDDALAFLDRPASTPVITPELRRIDCEIRERAAARDATRGD